MPVASERIVVQLTAAEKRAFASSARKAGLNLSEFIRRAARSHRELEHEKEVSEILTRIAETAQACSATIDETLAEVAASNARIAKLEAGAVTGRKRA